VTHTSFVLICLIDSRIGDQRQYVDDAIRKGFTWLREHADTSTLYDDTARVETYNVSYSYEDHEVTWQNAIWHPSLPYALSALVRHPDGGDPRLIGGAVQKIVDSQSTDGRWPNADGAEGISVWSVWPFLDALSDFLRRTPIRNADRVTLLSPNSILIRRREDTSTSLAHLAWKSSSARGIAWSRRYSAVIFLALVVVAGAILTVIDILNLSEFLLTLVFPIILVGVQEVMARGRSASHSR
jgi:hypothetical protein